MLLTERPQSDLETSAAALRVVRLRVRGGTRDLETIPLTAGNHSIGSGPKCSVRLRDAGVGPMHCLVVCDDRRARVRRWASDTLLNGLPFDEELLTGGDLLSVGPIELEIVAPWCGTESLNEIDSIRDDAGQGTDDNVQTADGDQTSDDDETATIASVVEQSLADFQASVASLHASDENLSSGADRRTNGGSRKLRSTLRRQQEQFNRLLARVEQLEQRIESALAERQDAKVMASSPNRSELPTEDWEPGFEFGVLNVLRGLVRSPLSNENADWAQERGELLDRNSELASDLALAQQQLAEALTTLAEAQATIDDLQSRLADSQRSWQKFSGERALWQRQLADLEAQLTEYATETRKVQDELLGGKELLGDKFVAESGPAIAPATRPLQGGDDFSGVPVSRDSRIDSGDFNTAQEEIASDEIWSEEPSDAAVSPWRNESYNWAAHSALGDPESERATPEVLNGDSQVGVPWTFGHGKVAVEANVAAEGDAADLARHQPEVDEDEDLAANLPERADDALSSFAGSPVRVDDVNEAAPVVREKDDFATAADMDDALAHLRELSLWRPTPKSSESTVSEPVVAPEHADAISNEGTDSAAEDSSRSPATEESASALAQTPAERVVLGGPDRPTEEAIADAPRPIAPPPVAPQSTSFIDRYAHMFEQDAPAEQRRTPAPLAALQDESKPGRTHGSSMSSSLPAIGATSAPGDAEESIEKYMAKMMQRIRGDAASSGSGSGSQAVAFTQMNASATQRTNERNVAASNAIQAGVTHNAPSDRTLIRLEDLKSKVPTPEFGTDMGALRALANQTARHAIGVHTARTLRRKAVTRFIVSLLAGTTSLYFILNAPGWESQEFSTACVALIASIYWGQLTFVSLIKAVRVGAFDEIATDFTPVDKSQPPLPIDVNRR